MFDILATMGGAAIGEIIKQAVSHAMSWAKSRKKPAPDVVSKKVEEIVTNATNAVVPDALAAEERQRVISGLIDVVRPTLEQVMEYSPNTQRIIYAARKVSVKKAAPKKAAVKKAAPKKASVKKSSAKKRR
jgi:hypothetical protein